MKHRFSVLTLALAALVLAACGGGGTQCPAGMTAHWPGVAYHGYTFNLAGDRAVSVDGSEFPTGGPTVTAVNNDVDTQAQYGFSYFGPAGNELSAYTDGGRVAYYWDGYGARVCVAWYPDTGCCGGGE